MSDKDSRFEEQAVEEVTSRTGLRAANTTETLKPKTIYCEDQVIDRVVDGFIHHPAPHVPDFVRKTYIEPDFSRPLQGRGLPAETIFRPQQEQVGQQQGKIAGPVKVSTLRPKPSYTPSVLPMMSRVEELEAKVEKLIGQVDGLLDRIALYNTKSSHKL